jgi:SAM-dependent methyltransferase
MDKSRGFRYDPGMTDDIIRTRTDNRPAGASAPREASDVVSTPTDERKRRMRGDNHARKREPQPGRRTANRGLWAVNDCFVAPAPVWGSYPHGFLEWALKQLRCSPAEVLHVCSGSLGPETPGVRADLRLAAAPSVLADGRALPFRSGRFAGVLLDPPYSVEYAEDLYGTDYPRPAHLLAEAARVVRPGGLLGILHFLVPAVPPGCSFVAVKGVTTGLGYRIRAFTVYQRGQAGLW